MLLQACRLGEHFDFGDVTRREIAAKDVFQVTHHRLASENEELALRLEIAKLEYQVNGRRHRPNTVDQVALRWAQIEVETPIILREARQTVESVNFLSSQDRQAAGVGSENTHSHRYTSSDVT